MASLEEAKSLYGSLLTVINEFKSPNFRSFFTRKANEDFKNLNNKIKEGKYSCVLKPYMNKQKDLLDLLKRQTVIYNMYFDENSNI